jgi:hypothetical protein
VVQFDGQTGRLRNAVLHNCRHAVVNGADVHEVSRRAAAGVLRIRVLAGLGQATLGKLIGRLPAGVGRARLLGSCSFAVCSGFSARALAEASNRSTG